MKFSLRKKRSGFTLIEMIVYVSVVAVIFTVAVNTILVTSSAWGNARVKRNIMSQGGAALERILREVRLADSVNEAGSTFGSSPGVLLLNTIVSPEDETSTTRQFFLSASSMLMRENAVDSALTNDVEITSLVFYHVVSGASDAVSVRMTVEDGDGRFTQSENFYGTAVLRRSY